MKKILAILLIATPMIFSSVKVESENQCQHGPLDGDKNKACGDNYNYNSATKACWCTEELSGIRKCNDASYSKEDACPPQKSRLEKWKDGGEWEDMGNNTRQIKLFFNQPGVRS